MERMSSLSPESPFLDTDLQKPLSASSPVPPVPLRSSARPTSPLIYDLPAPGLFRNPSLNSANVTFASPGAILITPFAKAELCRNDPNSVDANLSSAVEDENGTRTRKKDSKNSGRSREMSRTGSTTLVGYSDSLMRKDPRGYDTRKPFTSISANSNQSSLQHTRSPRHISASRKPQMVAKSYRVRTKSRKEGYISCIPLPTGTNQPTYLTKDGISTEADVLPLKMLAISERPGRFHKQLKAQETAYLQNQLLDEERKRTAKSLCEAPKLYPSPRKRSGGIFGDRVSGYSDKKHAIPGAARNGTFWIFFFLIQIGMISTGASLGVLIRDKEPGRSVRIGSGMLFWLICSISASILGIAGIIYVCGSRCNLIAATRGKAGLDELSLLPKHIKSENGLPHGIKSRKGEDVKISHRLAMIKQARKGSVAAKAALNNISGIDPIWQDLYTTPEDIRAKTAKESNQQNQQSKKIDSRTGKYPKQKTSIEAGTILSGGNDLQMFNESDIGMQSLSPMPVQSSTPDHIEIQSPKAHNRHEIDSRFPFSMLHSPAHRLMLTKSYQANGSTLPQKSSQKTSTELRSDDQSSPQSLCSFDSLCTQNTPSRTKAISGRAKSSLTSNLMSADLDLAPNLNNGTTPLSTLSPLESLANDLNQPEIRSLDIRDRQKYIISRRSIHEERGRKVRQSLERVPLAKGFGSSESGGAVEVVVDCLRGHRENKFESGSNMKETRPIVQEIVRGIETKSLSRTGEREGVARSVRSTNSGNSRSPTSDEDGSDSKAKMLARDRFYASQDVRGRREGDGHGDVWTL